MAQSPETCNSFLTLPTMINQYDTILAPAIKEDMGIHLKQYQGIETNFRDFAENRSSGFLKQFIEIFKRNFLSILRNKKALAGVVGNSVFISLLILSVFYQVGQFGALGLQNYLMDGVTE